MKSPERSKNNAIDDKSESNSGKKSGFDADFQTSAGLFLSLIPILLLIAFFFPSANPNVRFSYRDVAYYYYPLFEQIQRSWEAGQAPLWNPYINLGQPLAGDPTASVFYPGKLLFIASSLGLCSYAFCFKLFLWLHVALAFYTSSKLAKRLGVSGVGSTISGLSYAFSGQILFQYTNVIYLVGAAWAPLHFIYALDFFRSSTRRDRIRAVCKLSVVLAVTILGGEPQIVFLTLLTSTLLAIVLRRTPSADGQRTARALKSRVVPALVFLFATSSLTGLLSAVQILPSVELVSRSTRVHDNGARSLWDIPMACHNAKIREQKDGQKQNDVFDELLCQDFSTHGRSSSIYRFSVGPWRWLEFFFPNVGGKQYPRSSRWFEIFPEELSLWTPTLYFGIVPLLLALSAASLSKRRQTFAPVAATWLVLFGTLSALGGYGLVWFFRFLKSILDGSQPSLEFSDGDPIGGLYWFLNLVTPKFSAFRYPAKTLTLTAVGFSALAGIGWDAQKFSRRFRFLLKSVFVFSLTALLLVACFGERLFTALHIAPNPLFGPFQPELAHKIVIGSFLQTTLVLLATLALLKAYRNAAALQNSVRRQTFLSWSIALLVAIDLYLANSWLVVVAPTTLFESQSSFAQEAASVETSNIKPPTRVYRFPIWFPPLFQTESSTRRNSERVVWDVETLYPMYSSSRGIAILDVRGSMMDGDFAQFIDSAVNRTNQADDLAFLDVSSVLGPRCWVERVLASDNSIPSSSQPDWSVDYQKVDRQGSRAVLMRNGSPVTQSENDRVDVVSYTPNEIVFSVVASKKSDLVVAEQYWPDWNLKIIPISQEELDRIDVTTLKEKYSRKQLSNASSAKIEPTFGFLRKASVPQGRYLAIMSYRPKNLFEGKSISAIAWLCVVASFVFNALTPRKEKK